MEEYEGSALRLSPREAALLTALIDSCDCVLSRDDELIARVCGPQQATNRAVDVNIHRLRTKPQSAARPGIKTVCRRGGCVGGLRVGMLATGGGWVSDPSPCSE